MSQKKRIYQLCIILYLLTACYALYLKCLSSDLYRIALVFISLGTPLLLPLMFKLIHFKMTIEIKILNIIFMYFASLVGSCLGGYGLPFYDKVMHFSSGIAATILGLMIYGYIKQEKKVKNKANYHILLIFINTFNISIAALWEFYEYTLLILFNNDCINHYTTGVHDSITDMICAFIAGLLITTCVIAYYKKNQKSFFFSLYENFYDTNLKEKKRRTNK